MMIELANSESKPKLAELQLHKSLLTQMIDSIVMLFSIITKRPGYLIGDNIEDLDNHWGEILSLLSSILK